MFYDPLVPEAACVAQSSNRQQWIMCLLSRVYDRGVDTCIKQLQCWFMDTVFLFQRVWLSPAIDSSGSCVCYLESITEEWTRVSNNYSAGFMDTVFLFLRRE